MTTTSTLRPLINYTEAMQGL